MSAKAAENHAVSHLPQRARRRVSAGPLRLVHAGAGRSARHRLGFASPGSSRGRPPPAASLQVSSASARRWRPPQSLGTALHPAAGRGTPPPGFRRPGHRVDRASRPVMPASPPPPGRGAHHCVYRVAPGPPLRCVPGQSGACLFVRRNTPADAAHPPVPTRWPADAESSSRCRAVYTYPLGGRGTRRAAPRRAGEDGYPARAPAQIPQQDQIQVAPSHRSSIPRRLGIPGRLSGGKSGHPCRLRQSVASPKLEAALGIDGPAEASDAVEQPVRGVPAGSPATRSWSRHRVGFRHAENSASLLLRLRPAEVLGPPPERSETPSAPLLHSTLPGGVCGTGSIPRTSWTTPGDALGVVAPRNKTPRRSLISSPRSMSVRYLDLTREIVI